MLNSRRVAGASGMSPPPAFRRQLSSTLTEHTYYKQLFMGLVTVLLTLGINFTNLVLIREYYLRDIMWSAKVLSLVWLIESFVHIIFAFANKGSFMLFILDIGHIRVLYEYMLYIMEWWSNYGNYWEHPAFLSSLQFESFFAAMPMCMVQTYVLLTDKEVSHTQRLAFAYTAAYSMVTLLGYYKYLSLNKATYFVMCIKAIVNSAIRTILTALLISYIGILALPLIGISFLIGMFLYIVTYHTVKNRSHPTEIPLQNKWSHLVLCVVIGLNAMYVSYPFAISIAIEDWFYGYLVMDIKLLIENLLIAMLTLLTVWRDYNDITYFYAVAAFMGSQLIANFAALKWLHYTVHGQLSVRRFRCSSKMITMELEDICGFLEDKQEEVNEINELKKLDTVATLRMITAACIIQAAWRAKVRRMKKARLDGRSPTKKSIVRLDSFRAQPTQKIRRGRIQLSRKNVG